jgi:hypothetical protein
VDIDITDQTTDQIFRVEQIKIKKKKAIPVTGHGDP